jgi:hypothetical protein
MYAISTPQTNERHTTTTRQNLQPPAPARREHRERDFGIGYGNSSGYVSHRRYSSNWGAARFSCA